MTKYTFGDYSVSLGLDEETPLGKIEDLHICHLGLNFNALRQLPKFGVYEFEMAVKPVGTDEATTVKCCGVVVSSDPEGDGFRNVIHFSGLARNDVSCLETLTKHNKMRCADCGNC